MLTRLAPPVAVRPARAVDDRPPLAVDLSDLTPADLAWEAGVWLVRQPNGLRRLLAILARRGPSEGADSWAVDPAHLPWREDVLAKLHQARAEGRRVVLTSAYAAPARAVADHLGLFEGVVAGPRRESLLREMLGPNGIERMAGDGIKPADPAALVRAVVRLLRPHQWAKNLLVFVPALAGHRFDGGSLALALGAFVAFCLAASAVYAGNDLMDVGADRRHPRKRTRPIAAGAIRARTAAALVAPLAAGAVAVAAAVGPGLVMAIVLYLAVTSAYSLWLKRKVMLDVVTLAGLYTMRVVAGAVAIGVSPSEWLLAFSLFAFACLALVKRYTELAVRLDGALPDPADRDWRKSDVPIVGALAGAAGFNAVTVFALYIASPAVHALYSHPERLWLICPLLVYWIARALVVAHRREMHDDPVVFAPKDRGSLFTLGAAGVILVTAM